MSKAAFKYIPRLNVAQDNTVLPLLLTLYNNKTIVQNPSTNFDSSNGNVVHSLNQATPQNVTADLQSVPSLPKTPYAS